MNNRMKYIIKRNEYDLMLAILRNAKMCPIYIISNEKQLCALDEKNEKVCLQCIQKWLNKK